jgi:hypothetical protein
MPIDAQLDRARVNRSKALVDQFRKHQFARERLAWNVHTKHRMIAHPMFWKAMVSCLLTTQQRSGKGSPVYRFTRTAPFPLRWTVLAGIRGRNDLVQRVLIKAGGIRRHEVLSIHIEPAPATFGARVSQPPGLRATVGSRSTGSLTQVSTKSGQVHIAKNFGLLLDGYWQETLPVLRTLMPTSTQTDERLAADFIDERFVGFGPKQARNLLHWLGLARYEIPIDSRAVKWINALRLGFRVDPTRLQDRVYYCEVLDVVQHVC